MKLNIIIIIIIIIICIFYYISFNYKTKNVELLKTSQFPTVEQKIFDIHPITTIRNDDILNFYNNNLLIILAIF